MRAWLFAALFACSQTSDAPQPKMPDSPSTTQPENRPKVTFGSGSGAVVRVEVVDTEPKIERGLMFREHLPPDDGMLFLLGVEQEWKFWMRNTLISLDIVFITRDMKVAGISANAVPKTDTLLTVGVPSLYVVEVNGGWCAAHHVTAGMPVTFDGLNR